MTSLRTGADTVHARDPCRRHSESRVVQGRAASQRAGQTSEGRDTFGPLKVVILAGGFGTRLAEHTDEIPKPMVEVGGRPILWHILKIYSEFGFRDFLIAGGYKAEVIKRFFLEYREQMSDLLFDFTRGSVERLNTRIEPWRVGVIDTGPDSMTGGRIKRLAPNLALDPGSSAAADNPTGTFMMTYGDGVADVDLRALLAFHRKHGKLATFTAVPRPSQFGVPSIEGDRVVRFTEKPTGESDWISGGFFVLEPGVLSYIAGDQTNFELESLNRLAEDGQLMAYRHRGFWQPMDTLRDVRRLNALWAEGKAAWKMWS